MRERSIGFVVILLVGAIVCFKTSSVSAQFSGGSKSLGGYGSDSGVAGSGMGGGPMVIPYGGMTEGFMPGRMGGGSSLSYRPRPTSTMDSTRASSIFSSFPVGMSTMKRGTGTRSSMSNSMSTQGVGLGGGIFRSRPGGGGMGVMPPSIGYPFRQPPSLLGSSSSASGMSM